MREETELPRRKVMLKLECPTCHSNERYLHVTRADLRAAVEAGQPGPTATPTATEVDALLQSLDSKKAG